MTINEIASQLVILCRQGKFEKAQEELFSEEAMSVEPVATPEFEKETKGLPAIKEKNEKFESMVEEIHKIEVSEPMIATNSFCCTLRMELTMKNAGHTVMNELCVYEVKDGKIIRETFYM